MITLIIFCYFFHQSPQTNVYSAYISPFKVPFSRRFSPQFLLCVVESRSLVVAEFMDDSTECYASFQQAKVKQVVLQKIGGSKLRLYSEQTTAKQVVLLLVVSSGLFHAPVCLFCLVGLKEEAEGGGTF